MVAFENIKVPSFILTNGFFEEVNSSFSNIIGYSLKELQNKSFYDLLITFSYKATDVEKKLADEESFEIKVLCKDKQEKWLYITAQSISHEQNKIWCIAQEITDYKHEINKLQIREAQFIDILDNMSEPVIREDPEGLINYVNNAFCSFYGIDPEDSIGTNSDLLVAPADLDKYDILETLTPENPYYNLECRVRKSHGQLAWAKCTGRAFFDSEGELVEVQEVATDITELKKKQEEIKERKNELEISVAEKTRELSIANQELTRLNNYLNNILENISEGVAVINEKGDIEKVNSILEKSWGDLLPDLLDRFKSSALDKPQSLICLMIQKKIPFSNQEMILETRKRNIHCLISGSPLENQMDGVKRGVVIIKPINKVHQLVNQLSGFQARFSFEDIITRSTVMVELIKFAKEISDKQMNVLIEGESGTGKELFAQAIHNESGRREEPFIAVNCGAIPSELIGSELFGYSEGAFTGSRKGGMPGKFELASGGTIFLDEIGDMPLAQQVALLRVIQEKNVIRIGGKRVIPVDVKIICATNKDLFQEVNNGNFRQDLFYRLNVIHLKIPPLRERIDDIPILIKCFLSKSKEKNLRMNSEILQQFLNYAWPGNVRELQNVMERLIYITDGKDIMMKHLPDYIQKPLSQFQTSKLDSDMSVYNTDIKKLKKHQENILKEEERAQIESLLELFDNNISLVARKMNIARSTLYRKLKEYNLMS